MSTERITDLPGVTNSQLTDIIYAVTGFGSPPGNLGISVQQTLSQVIALAISQSILNYPGNPNGNVAGNVFQFCYDTTNKILYICTSSGSTVTAIWTFVGAMNIPATNGGTGVQSPTAHSLPVAQGSSAFSFLGPLSNGQLLIGSTGSNPVAATLTAGTNITISNSAGGITINAPGGPGFMWNHITASSATLASNNGYVPDNAGLVTLTLPATFAFGDIIEIVGRGAGGWSIVFNTSQYIVVGSSTATTTTGSVSSTNHADSLRMVCTIANSEWTVESFIGNLTIV